MIWKYGNDIYLVVDYGLLMFFCGLFLLGLVGVFLVVFVFSSYQ